MIKCTFTFFPTWKQRSHIKRCCFCVYFLSVQFLSSTLHFAIYLYWNKKLKSIMTSYSGWFEVCADKHRVTGHFNLPAIRQCVSSYLKGSESVWSWFRYSSMVYVFVLIGVSVSLLALEDKSSLWCTIIPFDLYLYARMMDDQGDQRPMQPVQWCTIDSSWPKKKKSQVRLFGNHFLY